MKEESRAIRTVDPPVDTNTVLGKVVTVLQAFAADDHELTLAELGRRTGLAKGTLHRVANDLIDVRLLNKGVQGYRLSGRIFELGMRASMERGLLEVAIPFMEDLYERTHETVHLGVLQDTEVVYLSKIGGHHQASSPSRVGGRMPLYCTAIGKVLLANSGGELLSAVIAEGLERKTPRTIVAAGRLYKHLEAVLETGVAFEYEESAMGLVCVAAAVLDSDEKPIGAISVAGAATRFQPEKHTTSVKAAAAGIADILARSATLSTS